MQQPSQAKPSQMKVTMLGTTGVGKTTFLVAMYEILGHEGREGFALRARACLKNPGQAASRELTGHDLDRLLGDDWKKMVNKQWPVPSDYYMRMVFELTYGLNYITDFEFVDYRGSAVSDLSQERYVNELFADLDGSNAVLVLADSWYIANQKYQIAKIQNDIGAISYSLNEYCIKNPDKALTIAIVLTKADTVKKEDWKSFSQKCYTLFSSLVELIRREHPRLNGTFIPVSVAGFDNVVFVKKDPPAGSVVPTVEHILREPPEPQNVHWPLLYCISKELERELEIKRGQVESATRTAGALRQKTALLDDLFAALRTGKTNSSRADEFSSRAKGTREEILALEERCRPLMEQVSLLPEISTDSIFDIWNLSSK